MYVGVVLVNTQRRKCRWTVNTDQIKPSGAGGLAASYITVDLDASTMRSTSRNPFDLSWKTTVLISLR